MPTAFTVLQRAQRIHLVRLLPLMAEALGRKGIRLRFAHPLESIYIRQMLDAQQHRLQGLALAGCLIFMLFGIATGLKYPEHLALLLFIHAMAVAPFGLVIILLHNTQRLHAYADWLIAAGPVCWVVALERIPDYLPAIAGQAANHVHATMISVIFLNVIMRVRFHIAVIASVLIALALLRILGAQYGILNLSIMSEWAALLTMIVLTLFANHQMEAESRRNYLLTQIQEMQSLQMEISNRKLSRQSLTDPLTGLANVRMFKRELERMWREAFRHDQSISLLFIDVDHFKLYNDTYGHAQGDKTLKIIAGIMRNSAQRPFDVCARYGGEEFVVMLTNTSEEQAATVAERIRCGIVNLRREHSQNPGGVVTVSLGVASAKPKNYAGNTEYLLKQADLALYRAKEGGRNRIELASSVEQPDRTTQDTTS